MDSGKRTMFMNLDRRWFSGIAVLLFSIMASVSVAFGQAAHVRWDIVSVQGGNFPGNFLPGGVAAALAEDGSKIVLTGSGTFVAPAGGDGTSSAVTGGGTWQTFSSSNVPTGSGTYEVTGLVRWEEGLGRAVNQPTDLIDPSDPEHDGLAVLRIEYSDGSHGILVVSCIFARFTPRTVFEGITASKGFVDYWSHVHTVPGVDANRTLFHIL